MPPGRAVLALLLSALATVAGACGSDSSPNRDDEPGTSAASVPTPSPARIGGSMILATTTSTQDSGLLDVLVPVFEKQTGISVKVIAVGTGAALEMGAKGNADAVLVHAPESEKRYVDGGDLVEGKLVMHNDFILVGPPSDPARVKGQRALKAVMTAIAGTGPFISRGDDSGTHKKELELWKVAAIDPRTGVKNREETGQGMGATLNVADQKSGYTLTDRATYLALKKNLKLEIVSEGYPSLLNVYHVYVVSPAKHDDLKVAQARAFAAFMVAPETQRMIEEFGKSQYGQSLFFPDAGKPEPAASY